MYKSNHLILHYPTFNFTNTIIYCLVRKNIFSLISISRGCFYLTTWTSHSLWFYIRCCGWYVHRSSVWCHFMPCCKIGLVLDCDRRLRGESYMLGRATSVCTVFNRSSYDLCGRTFATSAFRQPVESLNFVRTVCPTVNGCRSRAPTL